MKTARAVVASVVVLGVVLAGAGTSLASSPGYGGGSLDPGGLGGQVGLPGGASGGWGGPSPVGYTPPPPNPGPSKTSPDTWVDMGSDRLMTCRPGGQATPAGQVPGGLSLGPPGTAGIPDLYELVGPNGQVLATKDVCPQTATPAAAPPPPPPPPPPPSPAEVLNAIPFPTPTFGFDPSTLGVTQLATWFWLGGVGGEITLTVTIRGYTVVTTADPVDYYWYFGDGGSEMGTSAGSVAAPSVTHTYTTKGDYTVHVIVGWSGEYTFAGYGVGPETVPLGTVDGPAAQAAYGVQEIRSVGTGG
jgi:hypothetical protein